jgi:hypothetical protein
MDPRSPTHTAYALQRVGRRKGRWLEVGTAQAEPGGAMRVALDRLPLGGFSGGLLLLPAGVAPPEVAAEPRRPGEDGEDGED